MPENRTELDVSSLGSSRWEVHTPAYRAKPRVEYEPSSSNTRVSVTGERLRVGVDYLGLTLKGLSPGQICEELLQYMPGAFIRLEYGLMFYRNMDIGPGEAKVLSSGGRDDVHIVLPGQWCRGLEAEAMLRLLRWALEMGANFTRLDLAGDDYEMAIMPGDLNLAVERGELVTVSRVRKYIQSWGKGEFVGSTMEFGSRTSQVYLRVYDKLAESEGLEAAVRWELELKDEMAQLVAIQLVSRAWAEVWAERLVSFIDFRNLDDSNTTRRTRCKWFEEWVGAARRAVALGSRAVKSLGQVMAWLEYQAAPSLALLLHVKGMVWLEELAAGGRGRLRKPRYAGLLASVGVSQLGPLGVAR